jgi:glycosyltransferase involved in cell wall biosynthesis
MSAPPRVVLGMPAYDRPDTLARTLESLLSQTFESYALVITDDAPSARGRTIIDAYAREFPQITYEANATRLGMIGNWRRVFQRTRELYPESEYFAWVSDHDVWHARWLEKLVAVLDRHPEVVLAYPLNVQITASGLRLSAKEKRFETFGISDRADRLRRSARYMLSGDMIYGLVRAHALEAAGVFRRVITPDRQVLLALAIYGQFRQVPEVLWYREFLRKFDIARQRKAFFPDGVPIHAYLPPHLQHCTTLLWDFAIRGQGRPTVGRLAGVRCAASQLWWSSVRDIVRPKSAWRLKLASVMPSRWSTVDRPIDEAR